MAQKRMMESVLKNKLNWWARVFFILVSFFVFQFSVITLFANPINSGSNLYSAIFPTNTYDDVESPIEVVDIAAERINLDIPRTYLGVSSEIFVHESRVAAKGVIATGQRHHLLSNKIMRALNNHPSLKGAFNRENAKYIYNALDDAAHKGYQTWHRQYDATVVKWLQSNPSATPAQFNKYLHNLHQQPWLKNRIPNVNLLD